MKKLLIPLSLIGLAMIPGCTTQNNANIANTLSKNLTEMIQTAEKVTDIDENKLIITNLNATTDINKDYENVNNYQRPIFTRSTTRHMLKNTNTSTNRVSRPNYARSHRLANNNVNSSLQNSKTTFDNNVNRYYRNANNPSVNRQVINNTYKNVKNSDNYTYPDITSNQGTYTSDTSTNTNRYYTSKYIPRYTNNVISSNSAITSYLEKIQDLYTICNDTCAASYDLDALREDIINSCNNCDSLLSKVKSGEISLTSDQISTLTAYNNTLQSCINDLKNCKDCSEDVNIINSLKGNFSNNCDTLVAKYLKVLNNLDTNNSLCNNARCTVNEINNYINTICGNVNNSYSSRYFFEQNNYNNTYDYNNQFNYEYNKDYITTQDYKANIDNTTSTNNIDNANNSNNSANNTNNNRNAQTNISSQPNTKNTNQSTITKQEQITNKNSTTTQNSSNTQGNYASNTQTGITNSNSASNAQNSNLTNGSSSNRAQSTKTAYPNTNPYTKDIKDGSVGSMPKSNRPTNYYGGKTPINNQKQVSYDDQIMTLPANPPKQVSSAKNVNNSTPSPTRKSIVNTNTNYVTDKTITQPKSFSGNMSIGPSEVRANSLRNIELI